MSDKGIKTMATAFYGAGIAVSAAGFVKGDGQLLVWGGLAIGISSAWVATND